jgi:hypothetical protein
MAGGAEPVETFVFQHTRPEGAEEAPGTGVLSSAPKSPSPRRGEKGEKNPDPFSSSPFHGFRVGPQRGPAAPPVATIRRPVGAKHNLPYVLARSTIAISSLVKP